MRNIVTWTLSVILAVAFLGASIAKLTAQPMMVQSFASFGYPIWFMYVTAALELLGVVLILVPRAAVLGASLLGCIMLGAIYSHVSHGQAGMAVPAAVLLVLVVTVGWLRGSSRSSAHLSTTA